MTSKAEHPDALLTRDQTAAALTARGFPVRPKTLSTKASRGGGPPYQLFGPRLLSRWCDALLVLEARLSAPRRSTSEADGPSAPRRRHGRTVTSNRATP